jgi:hypothetical protein
MDPQMIDLLKALGPFVAAVIATAGGVARWLAARADAAEARATTRYDALLTELRDAARAREAYHAAESERQRADAKALGEALALVRAALERSTAILEALEPRFNSDGGRPSSADVRRSR